MRRLQRGQVVSQGAPRPLFGARTFERRQVTAALRTPIRGYRRGTQTVWADHLGGKALGHLRRLPRIQERVQRRVGVHVDESRAQQQTASVNLLPARLNRQPLADGGKVDGVIAHDIPAAQGVHADLARGALAGDAFTPVADVA